MMSVAASRIERVATYRPLYLQHNFGSQQWHIMVLTSATSDITVEQCHTTVLATLI